MDTKLLELLVCPVTKGPLTYDRETQELVSRSARLAYPVRDGIPVLLENEARPLTDDEIDAGRKPYCVMACMMRVLDIGPIDQLRAGTWDTKAMVKGVDQPVRQVQHMANPELTNPSIVFIAHPKGKVEPQAEAPAAPASKASS